MDVMQGYCWPLSAAPGEKIDFRMSTGATQYMVTYVRFNNKDTGSVTAEDIDASKELVEVTLLPAFNQPGRLQDTSFTSDVGCGLWQTDFCLIVPDGWSSGIYAAKCVDEAESLFYVTFIVNPDPAHRNDIAVIANTTSWSAYNNWGGYSRYEVPTSGDHPLSLLRPNPQASPVTIDDAPFNADISAKAQLLGALVAPLNSREHSRHLARGELWVLNWLTEAGYTVDVYSDLDLHSGIAGLDGYRAIILSTHPEYWSVEMVDQLIDYLNQGGRLLYLGGNGIYDAVTYTNGDLTTMTVHGGVNFPGTVRTRRFRDAPISRPESGILGVQYTANVGARVAYQVVMPAPLHRFFLKTGLNTGDLFGAGGWNIPPGATNLNAGGASGWEVDTITEFTPSGCELLAVGTNGDPAANMVYYDHDGGGFVFSAGSMTFGGSLVVDSKIQQLVKNVLAECLISGDWPGLWKSGIDAAVNWGNGKVYFFKNSEYLRYNIKSDVADAGYFRPIAGSWPGLWDSNIDAAVNWGNGKVYFFKGNEYTRYDINLDKVDEGYPRAIVGNWPGLWDSDIDSAVNWYDGRVYFFRGSEYIRYNMNLNRVDIGYPRPIAGNWPGLWDSDIDAIVNWGNGKVYFFKGSEYIRYDVNSDKSDEGYPKLIGSD
jgi:hypothetical protein